MDTDKTDTDTAPEDTTQEDTTPEDTTPEDTTPEPPAASSDAPVEVNGPKGPEPTRYGDWEQKGRCSDF